MLYRGGACPALFVILSSRRLRFLAWAVKEDFTDEEYQKLQTEFPHDFTDRIERLSEYIASSGKKYKNHLATIRSWARKDTGTKTEKKAKSGNPFLDMLKEGNYE